MFDGDSNWYWVCHNFSTILRVESIIWCFGGLFGICAAEALGDALKGQRGVIWYFQEGYAFGYLLAVVFQRAIADTTEKLEISILVQCWSPNHSYHLEIHQPRN